MNTLIKFTFTYCFYFVLLSCSPTKQADPIMQLSSPQAIESFVHKLDLKYQHFRVNRHLQQPSPNCSQVAQALKVKPWIKADIDQNGYADLLVHSRWKQSNYLVIVMSFANRQYQLKMLNEQGCSFGRLIMSDQKKLIEYFHFGEAFQQKQWSDVVAINRKLRQSSEYLPTRYRDTLIYYLNDFIEYNPQPVTHKIQSIYFKTISCLGHCPIFDMHITSDQVAIYNAVEDHLRKGKFKTQLVTKDFRQIINLLNYLNFPQLKDRYETIDLKEPVTELTINYNNGAVKKITDASFEGTKGLALLYNLIIDLRKTQSWQSISSDIE